MGNAGSGAVLGAGNFRRQKRMEMAARAVRISVETEDGDRQTRGAPR
jgi:hypothetical protein